MIPMEFSYASFAYPVFDRSTILDRLGNPLGLGKRKRHAALSARHQRSEALAKKLCLVIEPRLAAATDAEAELRAIAEELKALGHPLVLDEDDKASSWTIYADHPQRNLAIWVHWEEDVTPRKVSSVEVLWQKL
jgi:hypothetical protein